jgi:acyl-CoA thioesterase-1
MTRTLWRRIRGLVVLLSPLCLMLAACKNPSGRIIVNADPEGNVKSMSASSPSNSPIISGPIVYVALGDSTGSGVGATEGGYVARLFKRILTHRAGSRLINLCYSGATTADVLRDQLGSGIRATPHLVTLGIGINDIGHGVSLEQFSKNYEEIVVQLKNNTNATIVVTNLPDISSAPRIPATMRGEYHQLIVDFNRALAEIATAHGVIVYDVYTVTHEELPSHPEYFSGDGFHPSDPGYELWANRMWPTIARIIGVETETTGIPSRSF